MLAASVRITGRIKDECFRDMKRVHDREPTSFHRVGRVGFVADNSGITLPEHGDPHDALRMALDPLSIHPC